MIFDLVKDFAAVLDKMPNEHPRHRILKLLDEAVRRDAQFIERHPTTLFQCLWNLCWWYDCPQAVQYYVEQDGVRQDGVLEETSNDHLFLLLERWREQIDGHRYWMRSMRPPRDPLGAALLCVLRGHNSDVNCLSWSPDGTKIASGSGSYFESAVVGSTPDNSIRVWNPQTGEELVILHGHDHEVTSVSWSPDGRHIASACHRDSNFGDGPDDTVRIWDSATGLNLSILRHEGPPNSMAFSPDGMLLLTVSLNDGVRLWNPGTGTLSSGVCGKEALVRHADWSPDGTKLVTGSSDGSLRLWSVNSGHPLLTYCQLESAVWRVSFSPNGQLIAAKLADGAVAVLESSTLQMHAHFIMESDKFTKWEWSPDSTRLAIAIEPDDSSITHHTVGVINVLERTPLESPVGHDLNVTSVRWSPDGSRIASGSNDTTLRVWNPTISETVQILPGHTSIVTCLEWSPDGSKIASGSSDGTARIWNAAGATRQRRLYGHSAPLSQLSMRRDGTQIATCDHHDAVGLWDVATGKLIGGLRRDEIRVTSTTYSPDGQLLACKSNDNAVRVWNTTNHKLLAAIHGHSDEVSCLNWSPCGTKIIIGESGDSASHLTNFLTLGLGPLYGMQKAFEVLSPAKEDLVGIYEAATGDFLSLMFMPRGGVDQIQFAPDGLRILTRSHMEGAVRVWDTEKRIDLVVLRGHTQPANCACWSPDGTRIVTCCGTATAKVTLVETPDDNTIRVWDATTGAELRKWSGHAGEMYGILWTLDGQSIVSGAYDDSVSVWNASTGECVKRFDGITDLSAIARDLSLFPWRSFVRNSETAVECSVTGKVACHFPEQPKSIIAVPGRSMWCGIVENYLMIVELIVPDTAGEATR